MKKNLIILLAICLFNRPDAVAQNSGLYGKKAYFEVSGIGNLSVINGITHHDNLLYKKSGSSLIAGKDLINAGLYLSVGIATKRNFAVGVETGWWFFSMGGPEYVGYSNGFYTDNIYLRHEMLDARTFSLMPVLTFGSDKGLLPIGINHQIGIGFTNTSIVDKPYAYAPADSYTSQQTLDNLNSANHGFVDYSRKFKGFMFVYGLKIRTPLTKRFMLNYGLRYTLNFTSSNGTFYASTDYKMSTMDVRNGISSTRFRSIVSLNLGVTIAL